MRLPLSALAAVGALLAMPSLPGAASVTISISDATFEPPVAVVSPGSTVTWRNDGSAAHAIVGRFCRAPRRLCDDQRSSPTLQPGQSFAIRFPRTGEFEYHDSFNESATGTVVVVAGSRPPRARGNAEHRYRATVSFTAQERFEFTNFGEPSCPPYVGNGERLVQWTARLPNVTYSRFARAGLELLASPNRPVGTRLSVLRERMDARVSIGENPCTYVDLSCTNNLSGKPLWITLSWAPRETQNRFHVHNQRGRDIGWGESHCGSNAAEVFAGLPEAVFSALPFAIGPLAHVPQDQVLALATPAEVRRLRAGRSVRVVREIDRRWADEFYSVFSNNPPRDNSSGTPPGPCDCGWPGNQQIFNLRAKLVITLAPRR
jgi:plastocyanin